MKKVRQEVMNYSSISPLESHILNTITKNNIILFGVEEIKRLTKWNSNRVHNLLQSLEKKNYILRIKRNNYVITENINENIFRIATEVIEPSYISFWTALSYYGYTEQQIRTIQLVTTKQNKSFSILGFKINPTTFLIKRFFDYKKTDNFVIATPEKTFIDSLYQLDKCGGLEEYCKCLKNAWDKLNKKELVDGLILFDNKSMISRIGYIIDILSLKKTKHLEKLKTNISKSPIKLDPNNKKSGPYNKKWNILVNHNIKTEEIK